MTSPPSPRGWWIVAASVAVLAACPVRAESDAVVVIVESEVGRTDPDAIRSLVAERLGEPVISVWDPRAAHPRATVVVVFAERGRRARLHVRTPLGVSLWVDVRAPKRSRKRGVWVAESLVSALAVAEAHPSMGPAACREVINPWASHPSMERALPSELTDPFAPPQGAGTATEPEVLDPYAHESRGPSRPASQAVLDPFSEQLGEGVREVVDPWRPPFSGKDAQRGERGARLSAPTPRQ